MPEADVSVLNVPSKDRLLPKRLKVLPTIGTVLVVVVFAVQPGSTNDVSMRVSAPPVTTRENGRPCVVVPLQVPL